MRAMNGTEVKADGTTNVEIKINNLEIPTNMLVTKDVNETILGKDWLTNNKCKWNFKENKLNISNTETVDLISRKDALIDERIQTPMKVEIP